MPDDNSAPTSTMLINRLHGLIAALRDGPLRRPDLLAKLQGLYPATNSARRMIDRDVIYLKELGIIIERSETRPPIYTLHGGTPLFSVDELRTLALIRDTFGPNHPQAIQVRALLTRLLPNLTESQQHTFQRRQVFNASIQPAIDYTPYADVIARLEAAISKQQTLTFVYQPGYKEQSTLHPEVEPYEIEFYERHFYLVAYSELRRQVHDFRIDRIQAESLKVVPGGSWSHPRRSRITFRYRLAAELARGEISQRFEGQRVVERLPNGDVIIEAKGRSAFFIRRTIVKYMHNAEIIAPPWLREEMAREVAQLYSLYKPK